jgi:hypothetical protein
MDFSLYRLYQAEADALITRLEAAEGKAGHAAHAETCPLPIMGLPCNCGLHEADYAWRKAAGK